MHLKDRVAYVDDERWRAGLFKELNSAKKGRIQAAKERKQLGDEVQKIATRMDQLMEAKDNIDVIKCGWEGLVACLYLTRPPSHSTQGSPTPFWPSTLLLVLF